MPSSQTSEPGTERTLRSTVKNPRRRPRTDGDSIRTTGPRKRSKLNEHTFQPHKTTEIKDIEAEAQVIPAEANGHARGSYARPRKDSTPIMDSTELPMRGGKKGATLRHRPLKGDGATTLAQNKLYSVKLLPSTPKELRRPDLEYRGSVLSASSGAHLALAVTQEKAYVWEYTAHTAASHVRTFDIPFTGREGDALPFGALVPGSSSDDVGLVVVSASTGKIIYFESIDRAAVSVGLFQERKASVEGIITGFSSGEMVTDLVSAEHAGFLLSLSSGRAIHLMLRDGHGKARISTQVLRSAEGNGGLLGSLKGWYVGAWRKRIAAIKTRPLSVRGQMQTIALHEKCEIQTWNLDWSGWCEHRATIDVKDLVREELKLLLPAEMQSSADNVVALDFAVVDKAAVNIRGDEVAAVGTEQPLEIILLVQAGTPDTYNYVLFDFLLVGDEVRHKRTYELDSHHTVATQHKPRLLLPKPGHTAFVTFDNAVVLVATTEPESMEDPNAQLHEASYIQPKPFEDAIYIRSDKEHCILDAFDEDAKAGHSSTVVFVKGAGLVRVVAIDPIGDVERISLSIKSRIEMAVFYGAMQDNILDYPPTVAGEYDTEDVEEGALAVGADIMRSTNAFLSTSPSSIEAQLDYRARALRALTAYVTTACPAMSRSIRWQLLWNSEKVAAAQQMWRAFEEHKTVAQGGNKDKRVGTVLDELCSTFNDHLGLTDFGDQGDDDPVRRFFISGLDRLPYFLSRLRMILDELKNMDGNAAEKVVRHVVEADDLWRRALEAAFAFRAEHASEHGINARAVEDGVLSDPVEYTDLPEFWTSTNEMLKAAQQLPRQSRQFATDFFEKEHIPETYIRQLSSANPALIELCCRIYQERINWLSARPEQHHQDLAAKLQANYEADRYEQFRALASIGSAEQGMQLAERYRDMQTLTELVVGESQYYLSELETNPNMTAKDRETCTQQLNQLTDRIGRYFDKFGEAWANAFFDEAFSGSRAGEMLKQAQENWPDALTNYLHADSGRAKICWINDVSATQDFAHASVALMQAATQKEAKLWAKKVELSMSKLALLAAQEGGRSPTEPDYMDQRLQNELQVARLQEKLYRHIRSETLGALDHEAEIELAMKRFGGPVSTLENLERVLRLNIHRLLVHEALSLDELIDVLTLIEQVVVDNAADRKTGNLNGTEYFLALQTLNAAASTMPPPQFQTLLSLIWKRCYIADDWNVITSLRGGSGTSSKGAHKSNTDADIRETLTETAAYRTFYHLHSSTLLASPSCHIQILPPKECLDTVCTAEELAYRYPDRDLLDPILHDTKIQDEMLQGFVADRQLDAWVADCERYAKLAVEEEAARRDAKRTREWEKEEELGEKDGEAVRTEAQRLRRGGKGVGGVTTMNGYANGVLRDGGAFAASAAPPARTRPSRRSGRQDVEMV